MSTQIELSKYNFQAGQRFENLTPPTGAIAKNEVIRPLQELNITPTDISNLVEKAKNQAVLNPLEVAIINAAGYYDDVPHRRIN